MRKFCKKIVLYISFVLLFSVGFSVLTDPYNIFHYNNIRVHSGSSNINYVKTKYILEHPDKFNSFLFGSSRVGYIHVEQLNNEEDHWYNMYYPNGTLPEIYETIQTLLQNGIVPENILIGIDSIDGNDANIHANDLMRKPYPTTKKEEISFYLSYMNPSVSFESLFTLTWDFSETADTFRNNFYEYGGIYTTGDKNYSFSNIEYPHPEPLIELTPGIIDSLSVLQNIIDLCEANKINLILFTTPQHVSAYLNSQGQGFPLYLREIAKLHDIYSFSSINDINTNNDNYWEEIHYDSSVGDLVLERIFSPDTFDPELISQGFGQLVTSKNADAYLHFLIKQYEDTSIAK